MKRLLIFCLAIILVATTKSFGDGCFVAPKFVWDKHRDINEPAQKAILVYDAGREDLILQVKYEGPVDEFGWLIPVPNLPTVQKGSMKCFYELSQYTQRHFESAWPHSQTKSAAFGAPDAAGRGAPEPPVKVIEIKTVGAYEIAVLATKDSGALASWLETNRFYFPTNKTDVLDFYIRQQSYFIAVKVNLGKSGVSTTANKLAGGELNPLQISFASDRCVFPLKISSVNDRPSEIHLYVLSPEPLMEKAMFDKKLPQIYSNDLAQAVKRVESFKEIKRQQIEMQSRLGMLGLPSSHDDEYDFHEPEALPSELLPYIKVMKNDLPDSSKLIPRLAAKSWWLTKQTWTFRPDEMNDLIFEPAISVFTNQLGSNYGYFAAANLTMFGTDAFPALITALQNPNPAVRVDAASVVDNQMEAVFSNPRLKAAAISWLKDSEPKVRTTAISVLADHASWNPKFAEALVPMLRDGDTSVRHAAARGLIRQAHFPDDMRKFVPVFQGMLHDTNPAVRVSGLKMMLGTELTIQHDDLISFFKMPDREAISLVLSRLRKQNENSGRKYDVSNAEAVPLLKNSEPLARMIGLGVLYQNAGKQSIELALPLLKDSEKIVRARAAATLRALTGQKFSEEQTAEWESWWMKNKTNFVVQLHPEELRPQRFRRSASGADDETPPPSVPK